MSGKEQGPMRKIGKIARLMLSRGYWRGICHVVAGAVEHENFLRSHNFRTVLDAGANKGQFTLAVLACHPQASVIAFEPLNRMADRFEGLFGNDRRVRLIRRALGAYESVSSMNVSRRADSSSLLVIGDEQIRVFPGTEAVDTEAVTVTPLDSMIYEIELCPPVLLKIDVQGFELELLKGAERSLNQIDDIYVELSFRPLYEDQPLAYNVIAWLKVRGFVLSGVYNISFDADGCAVQCDAHFRNVASVASRGPSGA